VGRTQQNTSRIGLCPHYLLHNWRPIRSRCPLVRVRGHGPESTLRSHQSRKTVLSGHHTDRTASYKMLISEDLLWLGLYSLQLSFESKDNIPWLMILSIFGLDLIATTGFIGNLTTKGVLFDIWVVIQGLNVMIFRHAISQPMNVSKSRETVRNDMRVLLILQAIAITFITINAFVISNSWNSLATVIISFLFSLCSYGLKVVIWYYDGEIKKINSV
jgi:hypothetical protein